MNSGFYLINGSTKDAVNASDRAIQFGDGLFETICIDRGQARHLHRHMTRLRNGCSRLRLEGVDFGSLQEQLQALARQAKEGVVKLIVSRGNSTRGYRIVSGQLPTVILGLHPLSRYAADLQTNGIRTRICKLRLSLQPALAGIKHLNRLEQVLARSEWDDEAILEGLLLDTRERLVEGTMSNLFLVRNGELHTADLQDCGVSGVMRSVIIDVSKTMGIDTRITTLSLDDMARADEVFICNCVTGILPVRQVAGVCEHFVGPVTRKLIHTVEHWDDDGNEHWYSS